MLKYSDPFCILFSFRSVPQITNIHTGIGILRNGTELKLIIVREVFFRPSCMYELYEYIPLPHWNNLFDLCCI